jgi:hypothetical protein
MVHLEQERRHALGEKASGLLACVFIVNILPTIFFLIQRMQSVERGEREKQGMCCSEVLKESGA